MLVTLREVLVPARQGGYAVPGFDCVEDLMVRTILETCEALGCPGIIMGLVGPDLAGHGWHYLPGLVRAVADKHRIPVVLHLDHARELDPIARAVESGYSSVMFDGSALPFEENVRLTKEAVRIAKPRGVSVEGELGYVGGSNVEATVVTESSLTEPGQVREFVARTGVDALAVSIGTAHGLYTKPPCLNIERLKELNAASTVPLVLHGGSGTPDDQVQASVRHGIAKLNIYAENRVAMKRGLLRAAREVTREDPIPGDLLKPIREEMAAVIAGKIRMLGAEKSVRM